MAAFTLQSNTHSTASTVQQLFDFLSDFKNFKEILPADKVENFEYTAEQCSFNIKGITPMTIHLAEKNPYRSLVFTSQGLAKFNFTLVAKFQGDAAATGTCSVDLQGDLNPFIKAMAEKPLGNLVNSMALKLSQLQLP